MEERSAETSNAEQRENFKREIASLLWSVGADKLRIDDSIFSADKEAAEGYTSAASAAAVINRQLEPPPDLAEECLSRAVFLYEKESGTYILTMQYYDIATLRISCKNNRAETVRAEITKLGGKGTEVLTGNFSRSLEEHGRNAKGIIRAVLWVVKERGMFAQ